MKTSNCSGYRYPRLWLAFLLAVGYFIHPFNARAAIANVSIQDNFFSPATVTINQGDSVRWSWDGLNSHTCTGPGSTPLWNSGALPPGSTFTNTFSTSGTFAYKCLIHLNQNGSVTVQAVANVAPSISISSPTNGTILAAPWTGAIQAATSDPDDTVSKVDFYNGATLLGTVSNPPANLSLHLTNAPTGAYSLKAVATDSRGATNTSSTISFQVLAPAPISLSSFKKVSPTTFQFLYTATPGLKYIVQRSSAPPSFNPLSTNTASTNNVTFTDNSATGAFNVYSVKLLPNP